jgi:hypothetical protein
MKSMLPWGIALLITITSLPFVRADQESTTITTYYPSPNAIFNDMEVKTRAIVGDIANSHSATITNVSDIQSGQIWVEDSTIFNTLPSNPTTPLAGQVFFNNTSKTLEFYNGTWQKLGG